MSRIAAAPAAELVEESAGIFGNLSKLSPVGKAVGLAFSLYGAYGERQFQAAVLDSLARIEDQLVDIKSQFERFGIELSFSELQHTLANADIDIHDWCKEAGAPEYDTIEAVERHADKVRDHLQRIHDVVMGVGSGDPTALPWLKVFLNRTGSPNGGQSRKGHENDPRPMTSRCELAYRFFADYILPIQLKGLAFLVAAKDKVAMTDKWKQDFSENLTSQGKKCQEVINSEDQEEQSWWGRNDRHIDTMENLTRVNYGSSVSIPENHVIAGFEFITDSDGYLSLALYHGPVENDGRVRTITTTYETGTQKGWRINGLVDTTGTHAGYVNTNPIVLPDQHVVINLCFNIPHPSFESFEHLLYWHNHGLSLRVRHAKMNPDGTIDMDTAAWSEPPGEFINENSISGFSPWRPFSAYAKMDTPLTGVQIYLASESSSFVPAVRIDSHKNAFALTLD